MKRGFPGDPEFSLDTYWQLPYIYILSAISNLNRLNREELHNIERPITYLAYQNAEINRDKKKRRKPFSPDEFFYYSDQSQQDLPEPKYGAAAMRLIEMELFPSWALFTFKDLKARAKDAFPPELLCYQCEDAIILAPNTENHEISGMLIAMASASDQVREMRAPDDDIVTVRLPVIADKYIADEEAVCRLIH